MGYFRKWIKRDSGHHLLRAELPLRGALFTTEQMKQHGRALASLHRVGKGGRPGQLLKRLEENAEVLTEIYELLVTAVQTRRKIAPAGEWLLDNFYLIEEQIATAQLHMPKAYSRELPRLADGPSAGLPRVYDIALETVSHSDGRVHLEALEGFVEAYQSVTTLKLGELWAIPTMLRLALIENLRRVGATMVMGTIDRISADYWADKMTEVAEERPTRLITVIGDMVRSIPAMSNSFVAEFARQLQGKGSAFGLPVRWVEQQLSESGLMMADVVQSEIQHQAADQVSISNSITSLRLLGKVDWREFVEATSVVERILRNDPARAYSKMDFATRDHYRHIVEYSAKKTGTQEEDVATEAIDQARAGAAFSIRNRRAAHVGNYLVKSRRGRLPLEISAVSFLVLVSVFVQSLLWRTLPAGAGGGASVALALLAEFLAIHLTWQVLNWLAPLLVVPDHLPKMDFSKGIPPDSRTIVVIPSLLVDSQQIDQMVEQLEVRFLANRDDNLYFALLTDFRDAAVDEMPEDEELLRLVQAKVNNLNNHYGGHQKGHFFLFHRPRKWNAREGVWMGFERKRGKLADLNAFLRDPSKNAFSLIVGPTGMLQSVKYVITLDADTELPRGSARQMAGAMAHPLNRAEVDEFTGRVTAGYGILQPRVDVSLPGSDRSLYAGMYGRDTGIDPYTHTVSDVYQDVFEEGSFIGKGIYDAEAFERCLSNRFPTDLILSHDLIEGCYVRSGLLSDVSLSEEIPSHYLADVSRRHRWIRGDWQIVEWLFPRVPGAKKRYEKNIISMLSRWKILDNLRRSITPVAVILFLILAWNVTASPSMWTFLVLLLVFIPPLLASIVDSLKKPEGAVWEQHLKEALRSSLTRLEQAAFQFACIPHEALYSLDAILRSLLRVFVTRKKLLEWNTMAASSQNFDSSFRPFIRSMWIGPALAIAAIIDLSLRGLHRPPIVIIVLVTWFLSPVIAWWMSRPLDEKTPELTNEQIQFLHHLSRKTWKFFEKFVGPEDHWLPPDNFQEMPVAVVSHRTSPTNIGLALLANLAAYDFGYISMDDMILRISNTLDTLERLERHLGHFYNWYDTQTLTPLHPLYISTVDSGNLAAHLLTLRQGLLALPDSSRSDTIPSLARRLGALAEMEYDFLLDKTSHLMAIGYNVSERRIDSGSYDLLASEARLATFVAIAQGRAPDESWFALGRRITGSGGEPVLLSWSGSMFEYLMPLLVMPTYPKTLLDDTYRAAVKRQIAYGRKRRTPWGISECGYNTVDAHLNYQYRAFGIPGLGFKRGLAGDLVIAPYASALALMISPEQACANLERIAEIGVEGDFGMYEAIDYTPSRVPPGESFAIVQSYMAHHQGMSFLALAYLLLNRPMQRRFESDLAFQAATILLHERVPRSALDYTHTRESARTATSDSDLEERPVRTFRGANTAVPAVQLLSNGNYHVMVTNSGGGYSRWRELGVTRWREDATCDNFGTFCYIHDVVSGITWSSTYQPTVKVPDMYEVIFTESRAEYRRRDYGIETRTEIAVSPEDDIELRCVEITNSSRRTRVIEVTSYAEVVLAPPAADALHPGFSNLFIQTEIIPEKSTILCTRRPRSSGDLTPWLFHRTAVHGGIQTEVSFETDRAQFIGRGRTTVSPIGSYGALSGTSGSVLDPIVAIRHRITLHPEESVKLNIVTGVTDQRESCVTLAQKYEDARFGDRVFDLAWTHAQVVLRQINATQTDAQVYGRLAGSVIYANASLRADASVLARNHKTQSGLWAYSISGDLPIVLLRISDTTRMDMVRQFIQAHAYWRMKGLAVDLVIWNEDQSGYRHPLHDEIIGMIATGIGANAMDRPGGIFVRLLDQIAAEDRILIQTVARVVVSDIEGHLAEQLDRRKLFEAVAPALKPIRGRVRENAPVKIGGRRDLLYFNGSGGFTQDGKEYIITTAQDQMTPAPWVNVIANASFGTIVSESGSANTWSENAHEFRLTPWKNDPVSDSSGEAFYLRDEETGYFWSPSPLPRTGATAYVTRHGFGYTVFEHTEDGIRSEYWTYVAVDAPVKFSVFKIRNSSGQPRKLSLTGYVEWVLGDLHTRSGPHVTTHLDSSGAIFAQNPYCPDFAGCTAFFDVNASPRTVSGDRTEFIGRNGSLAKPSGLTRARLSGRLGSGLDPCGAIHTVFEIEDEQELEIIFTLGAHRDADAARDLVIHFRNSNAARGALEGVWNYWNRILSVLHVETPDPSVNVLANGWLVYQTLSSRMLARSGYYQPGGAFGFRDQLQDGMSIVYCEPRIVREHLLRSAAHQFRDGDVQHWWHPPSNRGVRTQCSDDYLWLPFAVARYVEVTGDTGVLEENVHFIEGRPVRPEEDSYYDLPEHSDIEVSLYQHCTQAILRGLRFGEHGLPLMGSGDWNDGMNLVGIEGKGESVWLAFFLYDVLMRFSRIAVLRGDDSFADLVPRQRRRSAETHRKECMGWQMVPPRLF